MIRATYANGSLKFQEAIPAEWREGDKLVVINIERATALLAQVHQSSTAKQGNTVRKARSKKSADRKPKRRKSSEPCQWCSRVIDKEWRDSHPDVGVCSECALSDDMCESCGIPIRLARADLGLKTCGGKSCDSQPKKKSDAPFTGLASEHRGRRSTHVRLGELKGNPDVTVRVREKQLSILGARV